MTAWRLFRQYPVRILIGLALLLLVMIAVRLDAAFRREQRIADDIKECGGAVTLAPFLPKWVPEILRDRYRFVFFIQFKEQAPSGDMWSKMLSLRALTFLNLKDTSTSDDDLPQINGLTHLVVLNLCNTQVTDSGLVCLNRLSDLKVVNLKDTPTTPEGRVMLRKTLPNCKVEPDP